MVTCKNCFTCSWKFEISNEVLIRITVMIICSCSTLKWFSIIVGFLFVWSWSTDENQTQSNNILKNIQFTKCKNINPLLHILWILLILFLIQEPLIFVSFFWRCKYQRRFSRCLHFSFLHASATTITSKCFLINVRCEHNSRG